MIIARIMQMMGAFSTFVASLIYIYTHTIACIGKGENIFLKNNIIYTPTKFVIYIGED